LGGGEGHNPPHFVAEEVADSKETNLTQLGKHLDDLVERVSAVDRTGEGLEARGQDNEIGWEWGQNKGVELSPQKYTTLFKAVKEQKKRESTRRDGNIQKLRSGENSSTASS